VIDRPTPPNTLLGMHSAEKANLLPPMAERDGVEVSQPRAVSIPGGNAIRKKEEGISFPQQCRAWFSGMLLLTAASCLRSDLPQSLEWREKSHNSSACLGAFVSSSLYPLARLSHLQQGCAHSTTTAVAAPHSLGEYELRNARNLVGETMLYSVSPRRKRSTSQLLGPQGFRMNLTIFFVQSYSSALRLGVRM